MSRIKGKIRAGTNTTDWVVISDINNRGLTDNAFTSGYTESNTNVAWIATDNIDVPGIADQPYSGGTMCVDNAGNKYFHHRADYSPIVPAANRGYILKIDPFGNVLKRVGVHISGSVTETYTLPMGGPLQYSPDGFIYLCMIDAGRFEIVKLTLDLVVVWRVAHSNLSVPHSGGIYVDPLSNVWHVSRESSAPYRPLIMKINSAGVVQFTKSLTRSTSVTEDTDWNSSRFYPALKFDSTGNVYYHDFHDKAFVKMDPTLSTVIWGKVVQVEGQFGWDNFPCRALKIVNNKFYFAGYDNMHGAFDSSMNFLWGRDMRVVGGDVDFDDARYIYGASDYGGPIGVDPSGNYYSATGVYVYGADSTVDPPEGIAHPKAWVGAYVVKFGPTGTLKWVRAIEAVRPSLIDFPNSYDNSSFVEPWAEGGTFCNSSNTFDFTLLPEWTQQDTISYETFKRVIPSGGSTRQLHVVSIPADGGVLGYADLTYNIANYTNQYSHAQSASPQWVLRDVTSTSSSIELNMRAIDIVSDVPVTIATVTPSTLTPLTVMTDPYVYSASAEYTMDYFGPKVPTSFVKTFQLNGNAVLMGDNSIRLNNYSTNVASVWWTQQFSALPMTIELTYYLAGSADGYIFCIGQASGGLGMVGGGGGGMGFPAWNGSTNRIVGVGGDIWDNFQPVPYIGLYDNRLGSGIQIPSARSSTDPRGVFQTVRMTVADAYDTSVKYNGTDIISNSTFFGANGLPPAPWIVGIVSATGEATQLMYLYKMTVNGLVLFDYTL